MLCWQRPWGVTEERWKPTSALFQPSELLDLWYSILTALGSLSQNFQVPPSWRDDGAALGILGLQLRWERQVHTKSGIPCLGSQFYSDQAGPLLKEFKFVSPGQKMELSSATNATPSLLRMKRWSSTCFKYTATSRTSATAARLLSATRATLLATRLFIQVLKGFGRCLSGFYSFESEFLTSRTSVCLFLGFFLRREAVSL